MVSIRDIFKRSKNEENKQKLSTSNSNRNRISDKRRDEELKTWLEDGLRKGYPFSHLRDILISRGLKKEADKLLHLHKTHSHKTHSPKRKRKTGAILLFASAFMFALALTLIFVQSNGMFNGNANGGLNNGNFNGKLPFEGYFISEADIPGGAIVNVNFSDDVGVVNGEFYGVNTYGYWGSNTSYIDLNGDGTKDASSDYQWHRQELLNVRIKEIRADMALDTVSLSEGVFGINVPLSNYGDIMTRNNLVDWARNNNIKIVFIASYMPSWLANKSGYCGAGGDWSKCPPSNYNKWGNLVVNFLSAVGCDANTCEVEVWNEPDSSTFWLDNLSRGNMIKATEYVKLYNATYLAVKSAYPNMQVGGPAITLADDYLMSTFLSNMTTNIDFVSFHAYSEDVFPLSYDVGIDTKLKTILANCSLYGANCSRIYLDEWNYKNSSVMNTSSLWNIYNSNLALVSIYALNNYPSNFSLNLYEWSELVSYKNSSVYANYPFRYSAVSEAGLDNPYPTYYPPYNVTKNFATYHSAGSMVVKSNSSSDNIKVVASEKNDVQYITVINAGAEVNVGINIFGKNASQIKDLETNETYNVTDGGVLIGPISQYQIRYFEILNNSVSSEEDELEPYCGNGVIDQANETCDDNNTVNNDGCSSTCKIEYCGNGVIDQANETCDDNNTVNNDGCSSTCKIEYCGDGINQTNEGCDDNNTINNDGCSSTCRIEYCGDGINQTNEGCDDGNVINGDGCSDTCKLESCGDEIKQTSEQCDLGSLNGNVCTPLYESSCSYCSSLCKNITLTGGECGDGINQTSEECDLGETNGNVCTPEYNNSCTYCSNLCDNLTIQGAYCGDNITTQANETCDDGNTVSEDGCSANCEIEESEPLYRSNSGRSNTIKTEEQCNNTNLNQTCEGLGYTSGILSYKVGGCTFDTSQCINDSYNEVNNSYNEENTAGIVNSSNESIDSENKSDIGSNQRVGKFSLTSLIFFSLVMSISILIFYTGRVLIRIRKYDNYGNLRTLLLT